MRLVTPTILIVLLFLVTLVTPITIKETALKLDSKNRFYTIASFGYRKDGLVRLWMPMFASSFNFTNSQLSNNITFLLIRRDDWRRHETLNTDANDCSMAAPLWTERIRIPIIKLLNATSNETAVQAAITIEDRYTIGLFTCMEEPQAFSISYQLSLTNLQPNGQYTHLDADEMEIPYVHLVYLFGLWPVAWVFWWYNWWQFRHENIWIYILMLVTPPLRWARHAFAWTHYSYLATEGEMQLYIWLLYLLFHGVGFGIHYTTRILISKGWCITRARLLAVEWRVLVGTGFFVAIANTFMNAVGGGSMIAFLTFEGLVYVYCWLNFKHQTYVLGNFIRQLYRQQAAPEILAVYMHKKELLTNLRRVILGFGIFSVVGYIVAYVFMSDLADLEVFQLVVVRELVIYLEAISVAYLLRLRPIEVIDLTPTKKGTSKAAAATNAMPVVQQGRAAGLWRRLVASVTRM